jgi:hypothetical protein
LREAKGMFITMKKYILPERSIYETAHYDVIIAGSGPAGVCAALSAARSGLKVLLIEKMGCIGGHWTSGMLCLVLDKLGKGGILKEITSRLSDIHAINILNAQEEIFSYDVEAMKVILEEMCMTENIDILLHTRVTEAIYQGRMIQAVVTENNSGTQVFSAEVFIDCTGNGDLGAYAGCSFDSGHPFSGKQQPATLEAIVSGVPPEMNFCLDERTKIKLRELMESVGIQPSYKMPTLFKLPKGNLWCFHVNHQYGTRHDSAWEITKATVEARKEIFDMVKALRRLPPWEKLTLVCTAESIGIREGRRIHGLYSIGREDIACGTRFEDGICTVRFAVDIHSLDATYGGGYENADIHVKPYHIPYRSLVAAEMNNLGMAGRCISGDFYAHASYRVTANCAAMGEALGYAAGLAIKYGIGLHQVDGKEISEYMIKAGYDI